MTQPDATLSELERDALTELVNIGVSRSAANLRKMVGDEVQLSVPSVEVMNRRAAAALIGEQEEGDLVAVRQEFTGAFSGRALLIFPKANSLELVRAVTGDEMSPQELADIEDEALAETGNVILNGCLASIANMLQKTLAMELPMVFRGGGALLFEPAQLPEQDGVVLFLYINFSVRRRDIRGYIAMLLDFAALMALKALVQEFVARVLGDDALQTA